MSLLDAALAYAARGWPVFPVEPRGKRPLGALVHNGFKDATTDPAIITAWWTAQPDANIGVATGAASGIDVVDLDVAKGDRPDGRKALTELEKVHGEVNTLTGVTGSGGLHFVFQRFDGVHNSAGRLPGIDVRAEGGYVVLPPSVHPNGTPYRWLHETEAERADPAPWPAWLLDALHPPRRPVVPIPRSVRATGTTTPYGESALAGMADELAAAPEGTRDDLRNRIAFRAGRFVAAGHLQEHDVVAALSAACERNGLASDLGDGEVRRRIERAVAEGIAAGPTGPDVEDSSSQVNSAYSAEVAPGSWPVPLPLDGRRVPEFPVEVFVPELGEWVAAEAEATQTPLALAGCVVIGVLSHACARAGFVVEVAPGRVEPLNVYALLTLPPANRKSAVFAAATAPLVAWERETAEFLTATMAKEAAAHDLLKRRLEEAKKRAGRDASDAAAVDEVERLAVELAACDLPVLPRLFADDVTPERLGAMLAEQRGVFAIMSAEGGLFETMAGRYSDGVPNLDVILKGHAGDALRVDRASRPPVSIDHPALTLVLTAQPDVLTSLSGKPGFRGRGLLARVLYVVPVSTVGRRKIPSAPMPSAVDAAYRAEVRRILDMAPMRLPAGGPPRRPLTLAPEAAARLVKLEQAIEPRLGPSGDLHPIADWAGKLVGAVLRFAGLIHVAENDGTSVISGLTFERAEQLGEFFLGHALAAFDEMGADPATDGARNILAYVRRKGLTRIGHRELHNGVRGTASLRKVEAFDAAMDVLVDAGWVRPVGNAPKVGPGRPRGTVFDVNPLGTSSAKSAEFTDAAHFVDIAARSVGVRDREEPTRNGSAGGIR